MKKLSLIVGIVAIGFIARADSLDDEIKKFSGALKSTQSARNAEDTGEPEMAERMAAASGQFEALAQTPGNDDNIEALVRQMMASNSSPDVQRAGQALLDDLEARKKARLDTLKAQVDGILASAPDILVKAQKTEELDGLLSDLQKVQAPSGNFDQATQALMNQVNGAYQFVAQWQDYLSARNNGNFQSALDTLKNLSNYQRNGQAILVPRSVILARCEELAAQTKSAPPSTTNASTPPTVDVTAILDGIKTLEDMEPALKDFKLAPNYQNSDYSTLSLYASTYLACKNGLPFSLDLSPQNYSNLPVNPGFERIRAMLFIYLLPKFIGADAPALNPNESVSEYINRATDAAESRQDWVSLQRIVEAKTKILKTQLPPNGSIGYLAALNQEMAGQYAQAVVNYQTSLRQLDDSMPARVVGDRLAAIKKDHPAEYEEGMKAFNNPPPSPYVNATIMRAAAMGYPVPGYYVPGTAGQRLGIPVPAGSVPTYPVPVAAPASAAATNAPPLSPAPIAK